MFTLEVKDAGLDFAYDCLMDTLGKRIRGLRESKGLTQDDLAEVCGVSRNAVSQWESGDTTNIKCEPFIRLYTVLGTSPQYLVFGTANIPPLPGRRGLGATARHLKLAD